jgi:transposase-like protein
MIAPPQRTRHAACWSTTNVPRRVRAHLPIEHVKVHIGDHAQGHDPGGVHNHVHPAEGLLRRVEHRTDGHLVSHVGLHRDRQAALALDDLDGRVGLDLIARVVHHDREATGAQARRRAIELARARTKPMAEVAKDLRISESCLRNWVAQADADERGSQSRLTSAEKEELAQLRRDKRRLEIEVEILKRAAAYFARENVLPN